MSRAHDPYSALGVRRDATTEEIVRAFRTLALRLHPDSGGGDHDAFARIRTAYETLSDPQRRAAYDAAHSPATPDSGRGTPVPVRVRGHTPRRGADVTARLRIGLAEAVHGGKATLVPDAPDGAESEPLEIEIPAGAGHRQRLRLRGHGEPGRHGGPAGDLVVTLLVDEHPVYRRFGRDLHATLPVSFAEAALGAEVTITTLAGTPLTVTIPPGSSPGDTVRVPGHGCPGRRGDTPGDLVVTLTVDVPAELTDEQRAALVRLYDALPPPRKEPRR